LEENSSIIVIIDRESKEMVGAVTRSIGGADATGKLIEINLHAYKPIPKEDNDNNAMPEFIKI